MKKQFILILTLLFLTSCTQRGYQSFNRRFQFTERYYRVSVFSGGKIIKQFNFKGIINQEENSDGIYWYDTYGELIEVSGDYIVESSSNGTFKEEIVSMETTDTAKFIKQKFNY